MSTMRGVPIDPSGLTHRMGGRLRSLGILPIIILTSLSTSQFLQVSILLRLVTLVAASGLSSLLFGPMVDHHFAERRSHHPSTGETSPPSTCAGLRLAGVLTLALALLALLPTATANANGSGSHQEVLARPIGPYAIRVLAAPDVGNVHIVIFASPRENAESVSDAKVEVSARGPEGGAQGMGPVPAIGTLATWYTVSLPIKDAGEWVLTLTVDSPLGRATVDFPVKVQEPGRINWVATGVVGVFCVVAVLPAWWALSWSQPKAKRPKLCRRG